MSVSEAEHSYRGGSSSDGDDLHHLKDSSVIQNAHNGGISAPLTPPLPAPRSTGSVSPPTLPNSIENSPLPAAKGEKIHPPLDASTPGMGMQSVESSVLTLMSRPRSPAAAGQIVAEDGAKAGWLNNLVHFNSLPQTPQPGGTGMDGQTLVLPMTGGNPREVMDTPLKKDADRFPKYTDSMDNADEVPDADEEPKKHETNSTGELEFNSFALDLSFGGDTSFGSPTDGTYSTLGRAIFHVFKGNVGAGVFLLPAFYKDAGYLLGAICIVLLGALMIDCVSLLLKIKLAIDRPDIKTYPAVVGFVLGDFFLQVTKFSLIFTQFGFCVMFVQYASSIFSALFADGGYYELFVVLSVAIVTPFTFFSNKMEILAYASIVAGVLVGCVLLGTTGADIKYLHEDGVALGVFAVVPSSRLIVFLSGHMFSLEGIGVVLPVENSLAPRDRPQFRQVVRYTLAVVVTIYISFGVLGYLAYGSQLHNSVVVALPQSTFKNVLQCWLGLSLLLGYPIQYVPAIQLVDKSLNISLENDRPKAIAMRLILNIVFGLCAAFIGDETLNLFASFLGAFVGVHLMITIPTLLGLQYENALNGEREERGFFSYMLLIFKGPYTVKKIKYFAYLSVAIVVWIGGVYFTIASVLNEE